MTTESDVSRFERRLGTAWLNRAGAVLLILGAGFFVKYAAERDWLGPVAWVAIGFAAGLALILAGHSVAAPYRVPAQGLLAVGIATLYLSVYAADVFYSLVGHVPAFAVMAAITLAGVALALWHDSRAIAVLATLGGFLTPVVLGLDRASVLVLFGFVAVLNAGMLLTAYWRRWPELYRLSFAGTQLIYWHWLIAADQPDQRGVALTSGAMFFLLFALLPLALVAGGHYLRVDRPWKEPAILTLAVPAAFFLAVRFTLDVTERHPLASFTVGLAVLYALLAWWIRRGDPRLALIHGAAAVGLLTLAFGIELGDRHVSPAWSIEALILLWGGFRLGSLAIRWGALVLLGLAGLRWALVIPVSEPHRGVVLVDHPAFLATVALVTAAAIGAALYQRHLSAVAARERFVWPAMILLTFGSFALLLTLEIELHPGVVHSSATALVSQTLVWVLVAAGLLLALPRDRTDLLFVAAMLVLAAVTFGAVAIDIRYWPPFATPLLNPRLGVGVLIAGLWALFAAQAPRSPTVEAVTATITRAVGRAGAAVFLLWTLSVEAWLGHEGPGPRHLALSLLWGCYALGAMALGLRFASSPLRLGAIGLFGLTVVKVFVFDLADVDTLYRILSFMILGGALLLASFLYARHRMRA